MLTNVYPNPNRPRFNIKVRESCEVVSIDRAAKTVTARDLTTGEAVWLVGCMERVGGDGRELGVRQVMGKVGGSVLLAPALTVQ